MADKKISELTSIVGADTAADDFFVVVDTSGSVTKKISRAELNNAIEQDVLAQVDITSANIDGGTIDNTPIGSTTASTGNFTTVDTTGNVTVGGNLTVNGTTTTVNSTTLDVDDINITVASGAASAAAADGAGLTVDGASATFNYASTGDKWTMNKPLDVSGTVTMTGATTTGDINFGDNDKAVFGSNTDLKIYSDGSNSYIQEGSGTSGIRITTDNQFLIRKHDSETIAAFNVDGAVRLYHDNAEKIATTATGADITGVLTADGLTVDGASVFNQAASDQSGGAAVKANGTAYGTNKSIHAYMNTSNAAKSLIYAENGAGSVLNVDGAGDVSLYADDGTTQGFFWDASTQSLGLGTTSTGGVPLYVKGKTNGNVMIVDATGTAANYIFDVRDDGTSKFRVDPSGNVGIGQSSPDAELHIGDGSGASDNTRLRLTGGTSGQSTIQFGDTASANIGQIQYDHSNNDLVFRVNAGTRATIDSSGNLLVGRTTNTGYSANSVVLSAVSGNGSIFDGTGNTVAFFNRRTSDGTILNFSKDGTTVGSIGSRSGVVSYFVLDPRTSGIGITGSGRRLLAADENGSTIDATIDLGQSSTRFKDLYLSGGVYLGGTGSANYLDDYEEGTWTPTISGGGANPTVTYNTRTGHYTKVGNLVTLWMRISTNSFSGGAGSIFITGVPFTEDPSGTNSGRVYVTISSMAGDYPSVAVVNSGNIFLYYRTSANSGDTNLQPSDFVTGTNKNEMQLTVTYRTT